MATRLPEWPLSPAGMLGAWHGAWLNGPQAEETPRR